MQIAHSPQKLHAELDACRFRGGTRRCISLIVTRGDLHDGHVAVINAAKTVSDIVVVAILPNNPAHADNLVTSNEFRDISFVERHHADILYAPSEELLGLGAPQIDLCDIADEFKLPENLLTTHLKILHAVQPDIMVWGERNFVEYSQVRRMISELGIRTQVQCIPTVRHANGVAVSSNDAHYSEEQTEKLAIVFSTLRNCAHAIRSGATNFNKVANTAKVAIKGAGLELSYFHILDEDTLRPADKDTVTYRVVTKATLDGRHIEDSLGLTL